MSEHVKYNDIIGTRELRTKLSMVMEQVVDNYQVVKTGNKFREGKTASIISSALLDEILLCYKFEPVINYDEGTDQYFVYIKEIEVDGVGKTKEDAVNMALDNVLMMAEHYFEEAATYVRFEKHKKNIHII